MNIDADQFFQPIVSEGLFYTSFTSSEHSDIKLAFFILRNQGENLFKALLSNALSGDLATQKRLRGKSSSWGKFKYMMYIEHEYIHFCIYSLAHFLLPIQHTSKCIFCKPIWVHNTKTALILRPQVGTTAYILQYFRLLVQRIPDKAWNSSQQTKG